MLLFYYKRHLCVVLKNKNEFLRDTLFAQKMDRFCLTISHSRHGDNPLIESFAIFPSYPF